MSVGWLNNGPCAFSSAFMKVLHPPATKSESRRLPPRYVYAFKSELNGRAGHLLSGFSVSILGEHPPVPPTALGYETLPLGRRLN